MPKIIHYRDKCIGCGICHQQQPGYWRMSRKDGKATLVNAVNKKNVHVLPIHQHLQQASREVAAACPVRVIKITV
jgi:ferredoxin